VATVQLNCRVEEQLAQRLREAATARHTTTGALVAQAIEALLEANSSNPAPPLSALAALEARVALLEQAASPKRVIQPPQTGDLAIPQTGDPAIPQTGEALTTPELAEQTGTSKGAWNTWASKATIGDIRHHPIAGSWRLLGKAALASGGPPRWLWEAV
jgi:hypothetical protein